MLSRMINKVIVFFQNLWDKRCKITNRHKWSKEVKRAWLTCDIVTYHKHCNRCGYCSEKEVNTGAEINRE